MNDVTMEDAEMVGITKLIPVISSGSSLPSVIHSECFAEFNKMFRGADLVISKGQGNYETLSDSDQNIVFMLKVKCPVFANDLGKPVGSFVVGKTV